MKNKYRPLLSLFPLLPLLMAVNYNAPAVEEEKYTDFEISYLSEEHYYSYYFYHFNVRNTGACFIESIYIRNNEDDAFFGATLENYDIHSPFVNGLIEPGFDKEVVVATKSQIPESKKVRGEVYTYYTVVEEYEVEGTKIVKPYYDSNYGDTGTCVYKIEASISGLDKEYSYNSAVKLSYEGDIFYIRSYEIDNITFTTNAPLNLDNLTVEEIVPIQSNYAYHYTDFEGFGEALIIVMVFLFVSTLIIGFGIFAAIFFPAMARKRRRRALENQNK